MSETTDTKPEELARIDHRPEGGDWLASRPTFRKGTFCYAANPKAQKYLELPNPREWQPMDDDWKLPEDWQPKLLSAMDDRLKKFRTLAVFMDICVRCGACADKCHFFIGSGDPKNMPVLRAELMRSVYRKHFTTSGKILGKLAGARELDVDVLKEWFYYFYQCTECRRCSVYCPYGIDTAEITMLARELMQEIGIGINWITEPAANCFRTGNHLGLEPHTFADNIDFAIDELEEVTGIKVEAPINRKGAEVLFIIPSADVFATPHYFTFLGYLLLFHALGLDYTFSAYASEGGNFGLFHSHSMIKRLNGKIYEEAKRLKVKYIIGGECGHMWRVLHQYMDTMNGPADFLEVPKSSYTGTVFENARATRMVHLAEFTADLLKHDKLKLDPSRNDKWRVTYHDSCNPARAMGLLDEPRYVLQRSCNHFYEMPENTIREHTFCCGSGSGLGTEENLEMRLRGGYPRASAVQHVKDTHGVNVLSCMCAIDKATLPALIDYWVGGVEVAGVHELLGNALVVEGEKDRDVNLRNEPLVEETGEAEG